MATCLLSSRLEPRLDHHSRMNAINIIQRKRPIRRRRDESGNRLSVPLLSRSFPIVYSSKHVSLRAARPQLLPLIFSTLYFRPESLLLRQLFPRCFVYSHFFPFDRWTHLKIFASFGYRVISFLVDKNVWWRVKYFMTRELKNLTGGGYSRYGESIIEWIGFFFFWFLFHHWHSVRRNMRFGWTRRQVDNSAQGRRKREIAPQLHIRSIPTLFLETRLPAQFSSPPLPVAISDHVEIRYLSGYRSYADEPVTSIRDLSKWTHICASFQSSRYIVLNGTWSRRPCFEEKIFRNA